MKRPKKPRYPVGILIAKARRPVFLNNCAVREYTADGVSVGRCWVWLQDGKTCPRHHDVDAVQAHYRATGELTDERSLEQCRKLGAVAL